ncbi:23S rRNA (pseudouridine(1915)-N(3))-methyltransferase RlmH [Erythrobacteraceae bacterium CFH 75059]|uniref:23S rRNA (pseudouridine(1915)-N(3))-methyltransferase RlmH n=1 Tax=Qipengyuania thermophila TaxID=2509361 RepID=UPI00101FC168|nr:23S rRNA (pseudouridine(1915)-N(3))-methyltransferase RlmH [Qipengyuania thermophila]TCD06717.1 23S rRNA (pseudouridine(1915)-N(3))-methyltransferase RlmH [Erythrobacteraceae bacterium CFH 75059]
MLLHVVARGKIGQSPEGELVARYARRIAWPLQLTELPDAGGRVPPFAATPARLVLLDERGTALASTQLAGHLDRWRSDGVREARFVIGAADGHTRTEREQADLLLAFGPATWPHLLARAMLLEQLYRATAILAGHPYHRAG